MRTLGEIARFVDGELRGDPSVQVTRVLHPSLVESAEDLALVLSPNAVSFLHTGKVRNAVIPAEVGELQVPTANQIIVRRPRLVLALLMQLFERPAFVEPGVHPSAVIDGSAQLGLDVCVGPHCWVGPRSVVGDGTRLVAHVSIGAEVRIGQNTLLHAGVRVGDRCCLGHRVIIQPNAVIGGDGFAFVTPERGSVESVRETGEVQAFNTDIVRINSIGHVVIEDDVEIGANTCIDRGTLGETRIGKGTKLDNLVQVGHNVTVGENCLIVAQVGLGGSSKVGDRAVVGGQAGLPDHLSVGSDAVVHAQAGITNHVPERSVVIGAPAQPKRAFLEREVHLKRLPGMFKIVKDLQQRLERLEAQLAGDERPEADESG
ncbi:MAG: UDP-3-O-(3-hydroxymyristoyl)glucosamine N-acyltransferase [Verrucomicrobia bacterium]|nr:UDP-3-O-(3-hydroxymyristoyl)glucosamine N-acyltransferase [Verrucomicrobiota bacterium]